MRKKIVFNEEWLQRPDVIKLLGEDIANEVIKEQRETKLIRTLLEAVIKNGEAGIHNGVMDRNLKFVEEQYSNVEYGLKLLVEFESGGRDFDYGELGELLIDSTDVDDVENSIYRMLDYYSCATKTICDFTEKEIMELAHCCEHH